MAEFIIPRNRDAHAAILGFRYQVDWTIVRCCELPPESHLELECGEDIDTVADALSSSDAQATRTLEQIKHLGRNVTLHSGQCVSAIANCVSHLRANPGIELRFRFCTNAQVATERQSPFSDRRPGIEVWRKLQHDPDSADASADLNGIAAILRSAPCPSGFSAQVWSEFQDFLKADDQKELLRLIRIFEWAVRQPAAETLSGTVREILQQRGWAATHRDAEHLHARLFLRIMEIISQAGRKIIDTSFLEKEAQLPPLRDAERRLVAILTANVFTIELRMEEVERRTLEQASNINAAHQRIDELTSRIDSRASMLAGSEMVSMLPPAQARCIVQRLDAVNDVNRLLGAHTWVRLRGSFGAGKTQLAILTAQSRVAGATWLSLRDYDESTAAQLIWHLLVKLAKNPETEDVLGLAVKNLPLGSILILEDLPRVTSSGTLAKLLSQICASCGEQGISLLSTSHFDLTPTISSDLNSTDIVSPPLNKNEIAELLVQHQAPPEFLEADKVNALHSIVAGHPMLATATIRHLSARGWDASAISSLSIAQGAHAASAIEQALHGLLQSVVDGEARELLYRLARVVGYFQDRTLFAAAAANPSVPRPRERFAAIEGIWVDIYPDRHFSVSPLVRPMSETELATDIQVSVDIALAEEMISRPSLSVVDVGTAAHYFSRGGDATTSALFLLSALGRARQLPHDEVRYLLSRSWYCDCIPDSVDLTIQFGLRARQIVLCEEIGDSIETLLDDGDRLLAKAGNDIAWAKASYLLLTLQTVSSIDFQRSCRHIAALAQMTSDLVASQMPVNGKAIGRAMWDAIINIVSGEDLTAWVNCLDAFKQRTLREVFRWGPAKQGCGVAVNRPWLEMHIKKPPREEWEKLLRVYEYVEMIGSKRRIEVLRARAIAAQIFLHAEYLNDLPAAVRLAEARLQEGFLRESNRFLVLEALGRQYLYRRENKNAVRCLRAAIVLDASPYPDILTRTHLELGSILALSDPQAAIEHAQISVEIAKLEPSRVSEVSLIRSLGELAIAHWYVGDAKNAFLALDEAVDRYFLADVESEEGKQLLPRLGHCASYFATVAATGQAPDPVESATPARREFLGWNDEMSQFHDQRNFPAHVDSIFSCLSMFAVIVEQDERAAYWAQKGLVEAAQHKHLAVTSLTGHHLFTFLVLDRQYFDALNRIREAAWASWCMYELRRQNMPMDGAIDAKTILGPRPNPRWYGAEYWALQQGMLPLALRVAQLHIQNPTESKNAVAEISEYVQQLIHMVALPAEWKESLAFIQGVNSGSEGWIAVRGQAERWPDDSPHGIRWMGYVASLMQNDIPVEQAALMHARLMCYVTRRLGKDMATYRRIALPFSKAYWNRILDRDLIGPKAALKFQDTLASVDNLPSREQDRAIALAALIACDAKLPNSQTAVKKWLRGE